MPSLSISIQAGNKRRKGFELLVVNSLFLKQTDNQLNQVLFGALEMDGEACPSSH
jgi:hypothetical protein